MLYDANKKTFKVFKDENGKDFLVTVLMLFQTKIQPQSEDKTNKGFFRIDIGKNRDWETLQKIWETLVLDCVTGNIPGLDSGAEEGVTGVRFIQKSNFNHLNTFRVEIWVKGSSDTSGVNKELRAYLQKNIIKDVLKEPDNSGPNIEFSSL